MKKTDDNIMEKVTAYFGTQQDLADKLGVTRQFISKLVCGSHVPILYALKIEKLSKGKFKLRQLISNDEKEYLR